MCTCLWCCPDSLYFRPTLIAYRNARSALHVESSPLPHTRRPLFEFKVFPPGNGWDKELETQHPLRQHDAGDLFLGSYLVIYWSIVSWGCGIIASCLYVSYDALGA
jgi:hypothetical protein